MTAQFPPPESEPERISPPTADVLPYARDGQDRMRVQVDNAGVVQTLPQYAPHQQELGAYSPPYTRGGQMSMDAREEHRETSLAAWNGTRARFTIT